MFKRSALVMLLMIFGIARGWTGGSITFNEVMGFARHNPQLVQEIEIAIKEEKVRPRDVMCDASRMGNHWEHLGGGRALPFNCLIGKRTLEIDGDTEFLDERYRVIERGLDNPEVFSRARSIREKNPTWEWR